MPNGEVGKSNTIFQFSPLNILYLPLPYSLFHFAVYIATRLLSFLWIKQLHIGRKNAGVTKIDLQRLCCVLCVQTSDKHGTKASHQLIEFAVLATSKQQSRTVLDL